MSILVTFLRLVFGLIGLLMGLVFILRIFAPGTPETDFVFHFSQSLQPGLDRLINALLQPVTWLLSFVEPLLPASVKAWFPTMLAANAVSGVAGLLLLLPGLAETLFGQGLSSGEYLSLFPGIVDWRLVLGWVFWRWVEAFSVGLVDGGSRRLRRYRRDRGMAALDGLMRQAQPEQPPLQGQAGLQGALSQVSNPAKAGMEALALQGNVDSLTQLLHKRVFLRRLDQEINDAKMSGGCLAVIEADVDDLGVLNELHSRAAGDALLKGMGQLFSQISTPQGRALSCRVEHGKLAMMLTQTSPDVAQKVAEMLRAQIDGLKLPGFPKVSFSASFGVYVVCFEPDNGSFDLAAEEMLSKADGQLYKAKRSGKDQVAISVLH